MQCLEKDKRNLQSRLGTLSDKQRYSAGNIQESGIGYYTFSLILSFLQRLKSQDEGDVYVGSDNGISVTPLTCREARGRAKEYLHSKYIIFMDEVPKISVHSDRYTSCLLCRNLIRAMHLPCILSGTESTLMNVVTTAEGSRVEDASPWVMLLTQTPATVLNATQSAKISQLGAYEEGLLAATRPLFHEWFLDFLNVDSVPCMSPALLSSLKDKSFAKKPNMSSDDGLHAQLALVFADSMYRGTSAPQQGSPGQENQVTSGYEDNREFQSNLIRSHYAYLYTPNPNQYGLVELYQNGRHLCIGDSSTKYDAFAYFKRAYEDELMYLFCLKGGLRRDDQQLPSSYVFTLFRTQPCFMNKEATKNNGHQLEEECMAAAVLASHRYTAFSGTTFLDWLSNVIAELNCDECWNPVAVSLNSPGWTNILSKITVPVIAPINLYWSRNSIVNGHIRWCANSDKKDGKICIHRPEMIPSEVTVMTLECKDRGTLTGDILVKVGETFRQESCEVCLLFTQTSSKFQDKTLVKLRHLGIDVCAMKAAGKLNMLNVKAAKSTNIASKLLIILDLDEIYENRSTKVKHSI